MEEFNPRHLGFKTIAHDPFVLKCEGRRSGNSAYQKLLALLANELATENTCIGWITCVYSPSVIGSKPCDILGHIGNKLRAKNIEYKLNDTKTSISIPHTRSSLTFLSQHDHPASFRGFYPGILIMDADCKNETMINIVGPLVAMGSSCLYIPSLESDASITFRNVSKEIEMKREVDRVSHEVQNLGLSDDTEK
jgi:hypothetical protein